MNAWRTLRDRRLPRLSSRLTHIGPHVALAITVYLPLLLTNPGRVTADTKTYLYLDPARLLSRAWSMWDAHVGLGTVSHQTIGYLWPIGPWYWVFERLGVPDWIAQRLWLGTLMFAAGAGVVFLLRQLDWRGYPVTVAAFVYALSPYVLTLGHRISVILLPWAGLPWMIAFCARAVRRGGWRDPALFALTVATVGSVNATSLLLAGVGPALWVPFAVWVHREVSLRDALVGVGRMAVLTVLVSAWWISGLWVQGAYGLAIVRYSEPALAVAATSTAPEVLRGLGYWFFYGGDRLQPWVEASRDYTQRLWLLTATYLLPTLGLLGAAVARWHHRAYFAALVAAGTLLAVGAYPWDDPPAFGSVVQRFLETDSGLAMRSLPRAVPLIALGVAVLVAAGVSALASTVPRLARGSAVGLVVLALAALPPLWQLDLVPSNLDRAEDLPDHWTEAAAHVDAGDHRTRVLEVPGIDFAAYRWGDTVDPITPGLIDRPYVARELVPYGAAGSADLVAAFDRRLQEAIARPRSVAPIARLMGAGTVLARNDLQYERYNTPRPRVLWDLLQRAPGLGKPTGFGEAVPNVPDPAAPLDDELEAGLDPALPDPPPVAAFPVAGALPAMRAAGSDAQLLVAGSGDGLVDAAEAGLLEGDELVLYSGSFAGRTDELREHLRRGGTLLVTDTNRRRGLRWSTIRDHTGRTEQAGEEPLAEDARDNRLPLFPDAGDESATVVEHRGGVSAAATSYGHPVALVPERRPEHAVDGRPGTAWVTAEASDARGERLVLTFDEAVEADRILLLQPRGIEGRWITSVRLRFDGERPVDAALDDRSRGDGQAVTFPARRFRRLEVEILGDNLGPRPRYTALPGVGFAEVGVAGRKLTEVVRLPTDLLEAAGEEAGDHRLAVLLTRLRTDPSHPGRDDEERALVRSFELPGRRSFAVSGEARLSHDAAGPVLDRVVGVPRGAPLADASSRLPGGRAMRASAAVDGDPDTFWSPRFGPQEGQWLEVRSATPFGGNRIGLRLLADGHHSVPTRLGIVADGRRVGSVAVPPVRARRARNGSDTVEVKVPRLRARRLRLVVEEVRPVETPDWYSDATRTMPVGIAEVSVPGLPRRRPPARLDTGCRRDLVTVDGDPVPVRITGRVRDASAGRPLTLEACGGAVDLGPGEHLLRAAEGLETGLDVDRLVLRSAPGGEAAGGGGPLVGPTDDRPGIDVIDHDRAVVDARVRGARPGEPFWLVLGQSHNPGWTATAAGESLGDPQLVDGYSAGWLVTPETGSFAVRFEFRPQRVVTLALVVSAAGALGCLALLFLSRGGRPASLTERVRPPLPFSWQRFLTYDGTPPSRRAAAVAVVASGGVAALVVGPVVGVVVAVAVAATVRRSALRWLLTAGSPLAMLLAGGYVVVSQARHDIAPGFEWPAELSRAHPIAWTAVALLVADVLVGRLWKPYWSLHDDDATPPRRRRARPPRSRRRTGASGA